VIVIAAVIAVVAVEDRTIECVHEPTLTTPAIDSIALVVVRGPAKVCRSQ